MHNRAIEEERRECRRRWVVAREQLRVWRNYLATQKTETWYHGALKHHENVLKAARERMREAAAARVRAAAREIRAEESSSPSRDAVQYADYILNHYSRNSHADKLCLASDLERHGWRKKRANESSSPTESA